MGDLIPLLDKVKLRVSLPNISGTIKLLKNGDVIGINEGFDAEFIVNERGAYRVEVYLNENAWIFSNHIRIGL